MTMPDMHTGYPSVDKPWLKYYTKEELDIVVPDISMYENLKRHANGFEHNVAIEYLGRRITYEALFNRIDQVSSGLTAIGVKRGDIVSVCLPNIPEAIYLIYAINAIGAIANMLDVRCGSPTLKKGINDARSIVLFYIDSIGQKFENIKTDTQVSTVIAVSAIDSFNSIVRFFIRCKKKELRQRGPEGFITWNHFIRKANDHIEIQETISGGNIDAIIAYTGGTTGEPKGVIGTNRNINAVAYQSLHNKMLEITSKPRLYRTPSLSLSKTLLFRLFIISGKDEHIIHGEDFRVRLGSYPKRETIY